MSSVQHVAMFNIGGVGLNTNTVNAGPYSDISIQVTSALTATCIETAAAARGFHGISCTCVLNGTACSNPNAGIYLGGLPSSYVLGGYASSIEDVYINGFYDGIYIGVSGPRPDMEYPAFDNILLNIAGGSQLTNLIHIDKGRSTTSICPPQNGNDSAIVNNVCDITIMEATSSAGNTIQDDQNGTTLSYATDPTVGMYVIGEQVSAGTPPGTAIGNSRFTTSPSVPTWIIGTGSPTAPCSVGDLYSIKTGTSGYTLWGCVTLSPSANEWLPII